MRRFVFAVAVVALGSGLVFISPALAAKKKSAPAPRSDAAANTITVIQDDGTAVTIEMGPAESVLPGAAEEPPAAPAPFDLPPARANSAPPEIEPSPYVDEIVAPGGKRDAGQDAGGKSQSAAGQKAAKAKKSKKEKSRHPKPPLAPQKKSVLKDIPPGAEITEAMAANIAMDHAPASRGYTVARQTYKGRAVYTVTFKSEEGPYDVLVDAATGDVLLSAAVEGNAPSAPTAPGHLPQDWEPYTPVPQGGPAKK